MVNSDTPDLLSHELGHCSNISKSVYSLGSTGMLSKASTPKTAR